MPSLIIPEEKVKYIYTASSYDSPDTIQGCIMHYDTEDVVDGDETISRGEHLKRYLFDNKHRDLITFDKVRNTYWSGEHYSCGMFIDRENTDDILAIYASTIHQYQIQAHLYKSINNASERSGIDFDNAYEIQYAGNSGGYASRVRVWNFDTFIVIVYAYMINKNWSYGNGAYLSIVEVYDIENHEIIAFPTNLGYMTISAPGARAYARPLTIDGNYGNRVKPSFRKSSIEQVTYAPLKRIDGEEATRLYMLSEFPENSAWETLHVGDKYILVLPYDTSTSSDEDFGSGGHEMYCAVGIDVTEDIANQ